MEIIIAIDGQINQVATMCVCTCSSFTWMYGVSVSGSVCGAYN